MCHHEMRAAPIRLGDLVHRQVRVGDAEMHGVFLGPLTSNERCYRTISARLEEHRGNQCSIPFKNFLLAYFLKNASCVEGRAR